MSFDAPERRLARPALRQWPGRPDLSVPGIAASCGLTASADRPEARARRRAAAAQHRATPSTPGPAPSTSRSRSLTRSAPTRCTRRFTRTLQPLASKARRLPQRHRGAWLLATASRPLRGRRRARHWRALPRRRAGRGPMAALHDASRDGRDGRCGGGPQGLAATAPLLAARLRGRAGDPFPRRAPISRGMAPRRRERAAAVREPCAGREPGCRRACRDALQAADFDALGTWASGGAPRSSSAPARDPRRPVARTATSRAVARRRSVAAWRARRSQRPPRGTRLPPRRDPPRPSVPWR